MAKRPTRTAAADARFTNATGAPVADNTNIMTAGPRGPALLQDIWLIEKLAHFDREVIPETGSPWAGYRRMGDMFLAGPGGGADHAAEILRPKREIFVGEAHRP